MRKRTHSHTSCTHALSHTMHTHYHLQVLWNPNMLQVYNVFLEPALGMQVDFIDAASLVIPVP